MSTDVIYIDTDTVYQVDGVKNELTQEFINDATVTLTLLDSDDAEITGQAWPLTLTYVAASDGSYNGTISDAIVVSDGDTGTAVIDIDGDGLQTQLRLPVQFLERDQQSLAWTSRKELENLFGLLNINKWADLENDDDADDISERIQWAVDEATADARLRLLGSPVDLDNLSVAPRPLRVATTRLAGVLLYESRGIMDTSSEEGVSRINTHKKTADTFFKRVQAAQLQLDDGTTSYPKVVDDDEDDEDESPWE